MLDWKKKDSADYHREMNSNHFERWWENTVLNKLLDQSVAVIHNAKKNPRQTKTLRSRQLVGERQKFRNGCQREESVLNQVHNSYLAHEV